MKLMIYFYKARRYDIKGKEYLRTLGKYYIVDIGLRNYLLVFVTLIRVMCLKMLYILNSCEGDTMGVSKGIYQSALFTTNEQIKPM